MKVSHLLSTATKRARRVRAKIVGTTIRPRVSVLRSNRYTSAQVVDDAQGVTLTAVSSRMVKGSAKTTLNKTEAAVQVGIKLAEILKKRQVTQVVFDRGGYKYHGRVKAVAESLREAGIQL